MHRWQTYASESIVLSEKLYVNGCLYPKKTLAKIQRSWYNSIVFVVDPYQRKFGNRSYYSAFLASVVFFSPQPWVFFAWVN